MTLTNEQRRYRRRKKDGQKDVRLVKKEDGKVGIRTTEKKLCVRVSEAAAERLKVEADRLGMSRQKLLTRILVLGIQKYSTHCAGDRGTSQHRWQEIPAPEKIRYKGGGHRQLNMFVSSTAWRKLDCLSRDRAESKAKLVNELILRHRFLTEADKARAAAYREDCKNWNARWHQQMAETQKRVEELED